MDYRYLTETKNEFNNFLCGILVPHLYHGIRGMLKYSENVNNQIDLKKKKGLKIHNPGIINIFKKTLDGISSLNNHEIEEEYLRIKNASGCIDWFDNLVRASFKSYVLFLTWDPNLSNSKYSDNLLYESIIIKDFIHKCYIISCNYFRDNPEIFISKSNKKEVFDILKMCVEMSIKKSLPYNQIIQEYLNIEFEKSNDVNTKEIQNIKSMVYNIMNNKKYGIRPDVNNLIIDESGNDEFINLEDPEYKKIQLENFINQEKINEQNKINQHNDISTNYLNTNTNNNTNIISENLEINLSETSSINENFESNDIKSNMNTSSVTILSRAEKKNKEIDDIFNNSIISKNIQTSKKNDESITSEVINSKTSITNIISSPPIIKKKIDDKINELFDNNYNKKNIKVTRENKNITSEKFNKLENFYDSMIK